MMVFPNFMNFMRKFENLNYHLVLYYESNILKSFLKWNILNFGILYQNPYTPL